MGEVYRARDTKLGRDVAIKILPNDFADDPERVARFQREAQVLAALNHQHIAQLYGFEEGPAGAGHRVRALVMELVEGSTLADRLARGPIPINEALPIARQIAEALHAAHDKGITHRDLKPANVALTLDGNVKVLDFGLARPDGAGGTSAGAESPTMTSPALMTSAGMILGTAAYMSPEQAKGRVADKRSDVWAFGCVLYEMLTGTRAFAGGQRSGNAGAGVDQGTGLARPAIRRAHGRAHTPRGMPRQGSAKTCGRCLGGGVSARGAERRCGFQVRRRSVRPPCVASALRGRPG